MKISVFIVIFTGAMLTATSACQTPGDFEMVEGVVQSIDESNGEMTVTTKDGETIDIYITDDSQIETTKENTNDSEVKAGSSVKLETDKRNIVFRRPISGGTSEIMADILPPMESIEDVFKALGDWDKAVSARELGLSWSAVGRQLGYGRTSTTMYVQLQQLGRERLRQAQQDGLITKEQSDWLYINYEESAFKLVEEIFGSKEQPPGKDKKAEK